MLLIFSSISVNAQIATYSLTAPPGSPTTVDPNASADDFIGVGVGGVTFSAVGANSNGWSVGDINLSRYYEIAVSPNSGYDMNITDLLFSERRSSFGIHDYQVRWSKSPSFSSPTTIATVNVPDNDLIRTGDINGLNIDVYDGETIYFRFYGYNAELDAGTWRIQSNSLEVLGTLSTPAVTNVNFSNELALVNEGDGTYNITVSITNPDVNPTFVDVVLIYGDAARVNGFTSSTVTFPASSGADETVTITITDDGNCDGNEDLIFELQNVSGGNSAVIASPSEFVISIEENDAPNVDLVSDDFETGDLSGWIQNPSNSWAASTDTPINGSYSMKHNLTVAGTSHIAFPLNDLNLTNYETVWRFQLANGNFDPSGNNKFWVYLSSSSDNLENGGGADGYAVGVNLTGTSDLLTLHRVSNGNNDLAMITSTFDWDANTTVGIEVTRDINGEWTLSYDADGGFDSLVSAGSAVDNTYSIASYFGLNFVNSVAFAGMLRLDDVSISQIGCARTYYSQGSGFMSANTWDVVPVGTASSAVLSPLNSFVVQNGHTVTLDNNISINNLTIESGGTLDMAGSGDRITLAGDLDVAGDLIADFGRIKMTGLSGTSEITGNIEFYDLEIAHSGAGVDLNSNIDVWGTLQLTNGLFDLGANSLTLKSDASNTAGVGPVTGAISGDVTVERYIQSGPTGWRNMGASVSGAALTEWDAHFTTTGIPGSDYPNWPSPANRFPSIKSYDETLTGNRELGWTPATNVTNTINDGQGFWMYLGGSELPATVDVTGSLITGEQTFNLDYTPSLGAFHDGWNLISNIYAATIDWDSPEFGKTGLEDGVWIWNSVAQQYGSYISGVGLHGVSNEVAHSQSFWVHANAASPTITFREAIKSGDNNADWIRSNNFDDQGIVRIKLTGNGFYDETALVFNNDATPLYEGTHDAMKFYTDNELVPSLATVTMYGEEAVDIAINSMPFVTEEMSIPLKALTGTSGTYVLSVESITGVELSSCLAIEDLQTGEVISLVAGESISIELNAADSTARFMIHLAAPLSVSKTDKICYNQNEGSAEIIGVGTGPWTYTWSTEDGEVLQVTENSNSSDVITGLNHGTYFVEVSGNSTACATRTETFTIFSPLDVVADLSFEQPSCNLEDGNIFVTVNGGQDNWNVSVLENGTEIFSATAAQGEEVVASAPVGVYTVIAENSCGTVNYEVVLDDPQAAHANFSASAEEISIVDGGILSLINESENATHFLWNMGDGQTYNTDDVVHAYTEPGVYTIELQAYGLFCQDYTSREVTVTDVALSNGLEAISEELSIWFNGTEVVIQNVNATRGMNIQIHDILGKNLLSTQSFQERTFIPLGDKGYPTGIYFVSVTSENSIQTKKIMLAR
jgi:hypothetical protein